MLIEISCFIFLTIIIHYKYKKFKLIDYNPLELPLHNETYNFNLLTYNVQRLPYLFRKNIDVDYLLQKYDVVCLQENFMSLFGTNKKHYKYGCVIPPGSLTKVIDSGLSIHSKHDIHFIDFVPFNNLRSVDKFSNKGFLIVKIKNLIVVNTHLQSIYKESDNEIADKQLKMIFDRCKLFDKVLICGDFNLDLRLYSTHQNEDFKLILPFTPTHWNKPDCILNTFSSATQSQGLLPYYYDGGFGKNITFSKINVVKHDELTDHLGVSFFIEELEDFDFSYSLFNLKR